MRNVFRQNLQRKSKHILCSITFSENHAMYEIMWKYVVEPDRPPMTKQHICIASWINKATRHTLRICNTYCFTMATMFMQTHLTVTIIHFACLIGLCCASFLSKNLGI